MSESMLAGPHQGKRVAAAGVPLEQASAVMILVHGRGATAESILELAEALPHPEMAYLAPQASDFTWYPQSFLAPIAVNEPGISSGLRAVADVVAMSEAAGIPSDRIVLAGFSQGACLVSEFAARNPRRYGGLLLFSGGVIGPLGLPRNYSGNLGATPVFIGCSDIDFHIPLQRVHETAEILSMLGAKVNKKIYVDMGHTIVQDEIDQARLIVDQIAPVKASQ